MRRREIAALVALGTLVEAAYYFLLVRPFPLLDLWATPNLDFGRATGYERTAGVVFLLGLGLLFGACIAAARLVKGHGGSRAAVAVVFGFSALHAVTLVFAYPLGSTDMVAYLLESRVLTHHGANPFFVPPSAFPEDPLFSSLTYWWDETSIYGPVWVLVGGGVALLAGDSLLNALLLFKAVGAALVVATGAVVYLILRGWRPREALVGTVLFAWNPLLVFESAANGHNDVAMALPALLALLALARGRIDLSLVLLMLSVLVKFVTVVLFPAFLLNWLRGAGANRPAALRLAGWGLLLAGFVLVAAYLPFWQGLQTIGPLRRGPLFTASPWAVLYFWLFERGDANASQWASLPPVLLFMAYTAWRSMRVGEGAERMAVAAFDITFAYLILASVWFQPWYLLFLVPFGVLAPDTFRRNLALLFSASAPLNYFVFFFLWPWYRHLWDMLPGQILMATAVFVPPLAYLVFEAVRRAKKKTGAAPSGVS